MADVYLARQSGPYGFSKRVALKVLKREIAGDDDNVKAFIREALVAAEFRHPNLAQVYEVGKANGQLFLAMELVFGVSLAAMLHMLTERGRELPRNVAVRIAIDTLDGLANAHEAKDPDGRPLGLVHRDISPQNIMVSVDGSVKVVDFGIARAELAFGRTMVPRIKGKFSYMAPEQWDPEGKLDARADLFSLGVVLYEMTTGGDRLFHGDGPRELYKAVVIDAIPDPRARDPSYPEPLARIVMRALERGPSARWQSARAMRAALAAFAQEQNWSLSSKAVADGVRAALGPGELEARWESVAGAALEPIAPDVNGVVTLDASGRLLSHDVPTRVEPRGPSGTGTARSRRARRQGVSIPTAAVGAIGTLLLGFAGGFALARAVVNRAPAAAALPVSAPRISPTVAVEPPEDPVRVSLDVTLEPVRAALATRWNASHPSIVLRFADPAGDPVRAVIESRAELAVCDHAPSVDDLARAVSAPGRLESWPFTTRGTSAAAVTTRYLVARAPVTGAVRTFADWLRAPDVTPLLP